MFRVPCHGIWSVDFCSGGEREVFRERVESRGRKGKWRFTRRVEERVLEEVISKMCRASSSRMLSSLESEDTNLVQELTETFKRFDLNGDGKISHVELGTVLRSLGDNLTNSELENLVKEVDADGDGFVDLEEFIALNALPARVVGQESDSTCEQEALRSAFDVFDSDKDGYISAEELHEVLVRLGDENISMAECQHMINCVDKDGDRMVDFTEFKFLMSGPCIF